MKINFERSSAIALNAMEEAVNKLGRPGVGAFLYAESEDDHDWLSSFRIIGDSKTIADDESGYNFIALAYSKASESIETGKNSGSLERPLIVGEFGYEGSAIAKYRDATLITSFSGITGDVDYGIARSALDQVLLDLER